MSVIAFAAAFAAISLPVAILDLFFSQLSPWSPSIVASLASVPRIGGVLGLHHAIAIVLVVVVASLLLTKEKWAESTTAWWTAWWTVFALSAVFAFMGMPFHPVVCGGLFVLLGPALLFALRWLVFGDLDGATWFAAGSTMCLVIQTLNVVIWVSWLALGLNGRRVTDRSETSWTDWTTAYRVMVFEGTITWKMAFCAWLLPMGVSMELGLVAALLWTRKRHWEAMETARRAGVGSSDADAILISAVKQLSLWLLALLMVIWLNASIQATGETQFGQKKEDMRDEVFIVMVLVFVGILVWALDTVGMGYEELQRAVESSKVAGQILEGIRSDWAKAFFFLLTAPFFVAAALWATFVPKDRPLLRAAASWRWSSILVKAIWLGVFYVCVEVGLMKVTNVFLAYLIDLLNPWPLWLVVLTIWVITYLIFLTPPAPGPPIYVVIGIVVTASALKEGWSFWAGTALAFFTAYSMKLAFTATAQKCIGEPLASSVWIRYLVGVQTIELRAIEVVLREQGFSLAKVFLLVGGPDWPVAVLCGMLRLSVLDIQIGISPVGLQSVLPCVLSGSLLYTAGSSHTIMALAETCLAVAGLLQVGCLMMAGYFVQDVIETHYEELAKVRPEDADVAAWADSEGAKQRAWERQVEWPVLPGGIRATLIVSFALMEISILTLTFPWKAFGIHTFKEFHLTSSVEEDLGGNVLNLVLPMGWVALSFFACSCLGLGAFYGWAAVNVDAVSGEGEKVDKMTQP